ncbi:MAG: hypothetical protein E3J96_00215 [Sulfurovum sp.]|nr:MAG: hypothetical protein E3J96_00215 [Sulfurovum sp.]
MREIKLKYVWQHKKDKDFQSEVFTIEQIEDHSLVHCQSIKDYLIEDGYEFVAREEWTGRKAKGVEIYESDIVKLIGTIGATTTIEFIDGAFYVVGYGLVSDWISEGGEWNNIEKLGNIWENPELLEAKS